MMDVPSEGKVTTTHKLLTIDTSKNKQIDNPDTIKSDATNTSSDVETSSDVITYPVHYNMPLWPWKREMRIQASVSSSSAVYSGTSSLPDGTLSAFDKLAKSSNVSHRPT